eukprot:CAMPEP_0195515496 /NCGR_PEP_ID=MMETSP0794_2-20130614/6542_1 /TAXON_ID=515487 /ORGANISM="Stephanopyxis turris, Strain CCMP 815" /LENGTH=659 /DNA_ID=CAMNT_0040643923 /DNA_START=117 /DNA_END=2096 /DNA_ORIENTATION=+
MKNGRVRVTGSYLDCAAESDGSFSSVFDSIDATNPTDGEMSVRTEMNRVVATTSAYKEEDIKEDLDESSDSGGISLNTVIEYVNAMGGWYVGLFLISLFILAQAAVFTEIIVIGRWARHHVKYELEPANVAVLFGILAVLIIVSSARSFLSFSLALKSSQQLHSKMIMAVLRSRVSFFDTNPIGRILNRFSSDIGIIDDYMAATMHDLWRCLCVLMAAVISTSYTLPIITVAVIPLVISFTMLRRAFVSSSRELKRLEGKNRSRIFSTLGDLLNGIETIRTNNVMEFLNIKMEENLDAHTRVSFAYLACHGWMTLRATFIVFVFLVATSFFAVLSSNQGWFDVDPIILGLSLMTLMELSTVFTFLMKQSAEFETQMVSVERVATFCNLPSETYEGEEYRPGWPEHGHMKFTDLTVRYRPSLPPSLIDVSFEIEGGQRVGVVGRTGSGKSTLMATLFRLIEAEEGTIQVDGVDISKLGLADLRSHISVIPQSPTLFSGLSIRQNLDPFNDHEEEALNKALARSQMMYAVKDLPLGIDTVITGEGSNFSVGERQLLCLARAILSKNKILVLDEATANVDSLTDGFLQEAVHDYFQQSTIIAVAHRLDTIIDYDRVLVLGDGKVLEYGSPKELLSKEGGDFFTMVEDTGELMSQELHRRANA